MERSGAAAVYLLMRTRMSTEGVASACGGGCKGSVPPTLFVFVGPHSVIRLLNAARPSSFLLRYRPVCRGDWPRGVVAIVAVKSSRRR